MAMKASLNLILTVVTRVLIAVMAVAVGFGIPLFWVWVGSQVQEGTAPSMEAIVTVLGGVILSYTAVAYAFGWIKARTQDTTVVRHAWTRSMRDTPAKPERESHPLEQVMIVAVLLVLAAFTVWFFLFANPGAPR